MCERPSETQISIQQLLKGTGIYVGNDRSLCVVGDKREVDVPVRKIEPAYSFWVADLGFGVFLGGWAQGMWQPMRLATAKEWR